MSVCVGTVFSKFKLIINMPFQTRFTIFLKIQPAHFFLYFIYFYIVINAISFDLNCAIDICVLNLFIFH